MKTKNILSLLMVLILTSGCFTTVFAQKKLNVVMKKCETMESVDMSVVQQKDPATKKIVKIIKSVTIKDNKALVDEFLKAFEADKNDAYRAIENKKNGKMLPSFYKFGDEDNSVSYTFSTSNNGADASVSMIQENDD